MSRSRFALSAVAAMLLAAAPSLQAVDLQSIPGTDTKLSVYGFVMIYANYYVNQNEQFQNQLIPNEGGSLNDNGSPTGQFNMNARWSRFGFNTVTPSANLGDVTTKIELDFASGNGSRGNPRMRQAVIGLGNWKVGYTWSNWLDLDAGPETLDAAGPVGQPCDDSPRYTQIRYTVPLNKQNTLAFSLEEHSNENAGNTSFYSGGAVPANAQPDHKYPTVVGAYTFGDSWGHVAGRVMGQYYGAWVPATATVSAQRTGSWAPAVQVSAQVNVGKDSVSGSVYTGKGLGSYGIEAPNDALINVTKSTVDFTTTTGWQIGYTHNWSDSLRSNFIYTGLTCSNDPYYTGTPAVLAASQDIKSATDGFVNLIYKVTKSVEIGGEYVYENAKTFGSQGVIKKDASLGNSISENKLEFTITAHF